MRPDATWNAEPWQVADGMVVYGADREKVGTIRNYDPQAGYFDIQRGRLFHKDLYITMSDIAMVDKHGMVLCLTGQELDDDRHTSPPTGGVANSEHFVRTEKEPSDVVDEEVPVVRILADRSVY